MMEPNYSSWSTPEAHTEFTELCALYPTGSLSPKELARLREHMELCATCRIEVASSRRLDQRLTLAAQSTDSTAQADLVAAKRRLFAAIEEGTIEKLAVGSSWQRLRQTLRVRWVMAPTFAVPLVCAIVASAGAGYLAGVRRAMARTQPAKLTNSPSIANSTPVFIARTDTGSEAQIKARDLQIAELERHLESKDKALTKTKDALASANSDAQQAKSALAAVETQQAQLADERTVLVPQLKDSRDRLAALQDQMKQTEGLRAADYLQSATWRRQVDDLTARLREKDNQIQEQQTLLSSDRDIRELMGARELFIADVFDIDRNGKTKQPFGRVFYTKSKSLIFYAFDLDKQRDLTAGVQNVAFQAWGMSDTDKRNPLNLGILYLDNAAKRRWVLRFDDPKVLDRINAVFVTVEPSGGSARPSGKQLLFAYLEAQPNHP